MVTNPFKDFGENIKPIGKETNYIVVILGYSS